MQWVLCLPVDSCANLLGEEIYLFLAVMHYFGNARRILNLDNVYEAVIPVPCSIVATAVQLLWKDKL